MHFPNDSSVLEASDIEEAFIDGTVLLPGGLTGIRLIVAVNPLSGKVYSDKYLPTSFFVTNGVLPHRMLLHPMPDMSIGNAEEHAKQQAAVVQVETTRNEVVTATPDPIVTEIQPADARDAALTAQGINPLPQSAAAKSGARTGNSAAPTPEHPNDAFTQNDEPKEQKPAEK